jgi:hypothetical protein
VNKDTVDVMFETLDTISKHTGRLNSLERKTKESADKLILVTKELEKQIESSSKGVLLQLIEKGNTDNEQLVKDITSAIATNIAKLSINAGNITVNIETDSIAKAISKLDVNNTNNIVVDTSTITKDNKQLLNALQASSNTMSENMVALRVVLQELVKKDILPPVKQVIEPKKVVETPSIKGMTIKRDKDNLIESIEFTKE